MSRLASFLCSLCLILPLWLQAQRFYVTSAGDDAAAGTAQAPWQSLPHAFAQLRPGDTLVLRGRFELNESVALTVQGTAQAPIVVMGDSSQAPVLDGSNYELTSEGTFFSRTHRGLLQVEKAAYVLLQGLIVVNSHSVGLKVQDSHHIRVWRCQTDRSYGSGISVWYSDSCEVAYCEITAANDPDFRAPGQPRPREAPHEALTLAGARHFDVHHNRVHGCYKEGIDCKEVSAFGRIHHNECYDLPRQGLYVDAWFGLLQQVELHDNRVYDCEWGLAISAEGGGAELRGVYAHHNLFYRCRASGILFGVWGEDGPRQDVQISHNTIYACGSPNHWAGITGGIDVRAINLSRISIINNISYGNYGFDLATFALPAKADSLLAAQHIDISHNLLGKIGALPQDTGLFEAVYAYPGKATVIGNPDFFSPEEGDFRLRPGSAAIGQGKTSWPEGSQPAPIGAKGVLPR